MKGLETEIPEDMPLNARTVAALFILEKHGVVSLQFDNSSDDKEVRQQLQEIAGNVGYKFIWHDNYKNLVFLIDDDIISV